MFAAVTPILILLAAIFVRADPNPTNPGPGDVFTEGGPCLIGWDVDTTGLWTTMSIELMTGDNINMVTLASTSSSFIVLHCLSCSRRSYSCCDR